MAAVDPNARKKARKSLDRRQAVATTSTASSGTPGGKTAGGLTKDKAFGHESSGMRLPAAWIVAAYGWDDAQMLIGSPSPLAVSAIKAPDNTVNDATDDARPETFHTCIVIASADPAERLAADVSVWGR
jgi:hypothetical protein